MKYVLYLLLTVFLMVGCNPAGSKNDLHPEKTYRIITIDNCEYIFISRRPWDGNMALAHKGNCKNH